MSLSYLGDKGIHIIDRNGQIKQMRLSYPEIIDYFKRRKINITAINRSTESGVDFYFDIPLYGNPNNLDYSKVAEALAFLVGAYKPGSRIVKLKIKKKSNGTDLRIGWRA